MKQEPTGTREWAVANVNFVDGCPYDCAYCYAKADALRFGRIKCDADWKNWHYDSKDVERGFRKRKGALMFPSSHDIFPEVLEPAETMLLNMLKPGNDVLIVTKPHLACVRDICDRLSEYKDHILWRFTIGSAESRTLKFWEPGAPDFKERLDSLELAFRMGFKTSVSSEPYLDKTIYQLVQLCAPYVTDAHWLGPLNKMKTRVSFRGIHYRDACVYHNLWTIEEWVYWNLAEEIQTKEYIQQIYDTYKDNKKIKFKNRIKEVLGLDKPQDIGMDI